MADIHLSHSFAFILIILHMSYSDESCEVKILSPVVKTLKTSVNDWLNISFGLDKCGVQTYIITVEKKEKGLPVILCRIHYNKTCIRTGNETVYSCRCVSTSGPVEVWDKLVRPGDVEYRWRWQDLTSGKTSEKEIFYFVVGDEKTDNGMTKMKFILSSFVVAVVAVILISSYCKKPRFSTTIGNRKVQPTPWGCTQLVRLNHNNPPPALTVSTQEETRCGNPVIVEDIYDRAIHDPRRNPPRLLRVEQRVPMEMFINEL